MSEKVVVPSKEHPGFSYLFFIFTNLLLSAIIVLVMYLVMPNKVWQTQLNALWWKYLVTFVSIKLFNSFLEFFFHRYVLHKPTFEFLASFCTSHRRHHALTSIQKRKTPGGKDIWYIVNNYPMTEKKQDEAAFFPWYSLLVFSAVISPLLLVLQVAVPSFPWFIAGNAALLTSLTLYEFVHAIEHWPRSRWDALIDHPRFGSFFYKAYSYHLGHHAVVECNESISGFFIIPINGLFGTFQLPQNLYVSGSKWEKSEFIIPRPCRFIRWLDKWVDNRIAKRRKKTQTAT